MATLSIARSMVPRQEHTRQAFPAPRAQAPDDWEFNPQRAQEYDWRPDNAIQNDFNYFALNEGYQNVKNGMFNPLTGLETIFGNVDYHLNPNDQEATNAHMSGYGLQKVTRVQDNQSPAGVMRWPPYQYSTNTRANIWVGTYQGSTRK